jgi:uncharacterized damage-inducible protein DinB
VHRTLNHLVVGDLVWLRRLRQCGVDRGHPFEALDDAVLAMPAGTTLSTELFADWATLRARRAQLDTAIETWLAQAPDDFPQWTMRYANTAGVQREHAAWQALTHFFNHQAHHRGQVTTLLTQAGVEVGDTDLVALLQHSPERLAG